LEKKSKKKSNSVARTRLSERKHHHRIPNGETREEINVNISSPVSSVVKLFSTRFTQTQQEFAHIIAAREKAARKRPFVNPSETI